MELLYPRVCPVCGERIPFRRSRCSCSDQAPQFVPPDVGDLSNDPDRLDPFTAVYYYNGSVRFDLLSLKVFGRVSCVKPFSHAMARRVAEVFPDVSFDCVTFVPMHPLDLRKRSFNQSALLAQTVAADLFIPCSALLQKVCTTQNQHTLSQTQRLENLIGAFAPTALVSPGSTVLLVDDIKTTGTTLRRCRDVLIHAGVSAVYCLACAMTDYGTLDF